VAQGSDVSAAAWLGGCWVATSPTGRTTEEMWMRPAGGTMLGMSRSVREGIATGYEFLLLRSVDGRLVYSAHPSGQAPADFQVTEVSANKLSVENADHDFPQRIEYVPIGADSVVASVYAAVDDTRPAFSLHYRRSACEPEAPTSRTGGSS
jgi:hypothetical protein